LKVLITGGRTSISNRSPTNRNFECSVWAVARACRMSGIDYDVRVVTPGEDLEDYAAVFVEPPNPTWVTARHAAGALWTLRQREDAIVLYTHHDMRSLFNGLRKLVEDPTLLERRHNVFEKRHRADVLIAAAMLVGGAGPWRHLVHCHPWGDRQLLLDEMPISRDAFTWYDPSFLLPGAWAGLTVGERERRWVHAAWEDHRRWVTDLKLDWPVDEYGRRSNGAIAKLSLLLLMRHYAFNWGSLVHPYSHAGSGYFRSRYVYALRAGSVLGVNTEDAAAMNSVIFPAPTDIERLDSPALLALSMDQQDWYETNSWSAQRASAHLNVMMLAG
jgi:hypothetical protein